MPRGVYDRSKMKKNKKPAAQAATAKAAPKAPKLTKTGKPRRRRRTKAEMQAARAVDVAQKQQVKTKAKKGVTAKAVPTVMATEVTVADQFAIVRENVVALSQVRANMANRNGSDVDTVDEELRSELELMGILRARHFGNLTDEQQTQTEVETAPAQSPDNGVRTSTVPLPPPPQIQPLPTPTSA